MRTDYEDPQLDELLADYARSWNADFAPPPLTGMIEQATGRPAPRRRWLLAAAAAVLLLVVPVATVLTLHRHGSVGQPASGVPGRLLGSTPWTGAVLLADGRTVAVRVSTNVPCGQPIPTARASVVRSTSSTVTITVRLYVGSDAPLAKSAPGSSCANSPAETVSYRPTVKSARLAGRKLVDGATGQQHQWLDTREVASPTFVPAGFTDDGISWDETKFAQEPDVYRNYHNAIGTLTIDRLTYRQPADLWEFGTEVGPIHGHTGWWVAAGGRLSWRQGDYVWTISQVAYNGSNRIQLGLAPLLKIANSLP